MKLLIITLLIMIDSVAFGYDVEAIKKADSIVSCIEQSAEAMDIFHAAMLKIQGVTKTEDKYHNIIVLVFSETDIFADLVGPDAEKRTRITLDKCREEK